MTKICFQTHGQPQGLKYIEVDSRTLQEPS